MIIPQVHLNGTSREELLKQLGDAQDAIITAITAMGRAAPHGRDYYPISDEAITQARDEHYARIAKLDEVLKELRDITDGVFVQERR